MISIFFASVAVFIWLFGVGRKIMLEANKAANTAKSLYNDTHTIYLDGRPHTDATDILSRSDERGKESALPSCGDRWRSVVYIL